MKLYISIMSFLLCGIVFGQEGQSYQRSSSWFGASATIPLKGKFSMEAEVHLRRTDFLEQWQQIILRPTLHYRLNQSVDFAVGYSYLRNYAYADYAIPIDADENNIWEQVTLYHSSGKVKFSHRFRFEQRFIDKIVATPSGDGYETNGNTYANRLRYRFMITLPLFKLSDNFVVGGKFFDELWINEKQKGLVPESLNQNWFYVGLDFPVTKKMTFGVGYMNDYLQLQNNSHENNNILYTSINYKF